MRILSEVKQFCVIGFKLHKQSIAILAQISFKYLFWRCWKCFLRRFLIQQACDMLKKWVETFHGPETKAMNDFCQKK
jgi:hypothetical protein